ncbi:hypothetical protein AB1L88_10150 [Tautonia sp. JC769]|uniref:hypothetical protein n=1 Tax=Tautonia sp. JC769 TaxID=3232135 RepID=UPI00345A553D
MTTGNARQVQVADALILVAATAIGLAWGRESLGVAISGEGVGLLAREFDAPRPMTFAERLRQFTMGAARLLACGSIAVLIVRLRPPRPRRARLISQPGTVAAAVTAAYLLVVAAGFVLAVVIRAKYKPTWSDYAGQAVPPYEIAQAIGAVWLVLAFAGRWRPERCWIDRLGIAIGLAWIGLTVGSNLFDWW